MIIEFPFRMSELQIKPNYNFFDISKGFDKDYSFFSSFSSIFFIFGTPLGALPIFKELNNSISRRIKKVYRNTIITLFILYCFVGIIGFLEVPNSPRLIIDRDKIFKNDFAMTIGKIFFCFSLILSYAANYICLRVSYIDFFYESNDTFKKSFWNNFLITLFTICGTTTVSCLYNKFTDYMAIFGGFFSVVISFFFPTLMWLLTTRTIPKYHWKRITIVTLTTLCIIFGWVSAVFTTIKIIK